MLRGRSDISEMRRKPVSQLAPGLTVVQRNAERAEDRVNDITRGANNGKNPPRTRNSQGTEQVLPEKEVWRCQFGEGVRSEVLK